MSESRKSSSAQIPICVLTGFDGVATCPRIAIFTGLRVNRRRRGRLEVERSNIR
ncbi:MAG: hypothetical protein WAX69_11060 [Victivallales bacterium]